MGSDSVYCPQYSKWEYRCVFTDEQAGKKCKCEGNLRVEIETNYL